MNTPPKKESNDDSVSRAPSKLPLPTILSEEGKTISKIIDFDKEEAVVKYCAVFHKTLSKYKILFMPFISASNDLLIEEDFDIENNKATPFICDLLSYNRRNKRLDIYAKLESEFKIIDKIMERATSYCADNEDIQHLIEFINKYKAIIKKIIHFSKKELVTRIPTCMISGRDIDEDYYEPDIEDKDYYEKYLKYKNKYLELKKKF